MAKCKGCGAPIIWVKTEKGKKTPVDERLERRYVMTGKEPGEYGEEVPLVKMVATYTPHHATCPKAREFRTA